MTPALAKDKLLIVLLFVTVNAAAAVDLVPAAVGAPDAIEAALARLGGVWVPLLTVLAFLTLLLLRQRLFDFYPLFLFGALAFNLWFLTLYAYGWAELSDLRIREFDLATFYTAAVFAYFAVVALHLGALLAAGYERSGEGGRAPPAPAPDPLKRQAALTSAGLLLLAALPGAAYFYGELLAKVAAGGYAAVWDRAHAATGLGAADQILAGFLVPAGFFLLIAAVYARDSGRRYLWLLLAAGAIVAVYSLMYMYVGRRAHMVMFAVAFLIVADRLRFSIPRGQLAIGGLVLLLLFAGIKEVRNTPAAERAQLSAVTLSADVTARGVEPFIEMGRTIRTVYWAVYYFPEERGFEQGRTYGWALATVMPNVFWDTHPAVGQGVGVWLTEQYKQEWSSDRGGGVGSSFITEGYGNFGAYSLAVFLLLGLAIQGFVAWARQGDPARWVWVGATFATAFLFVRGESHSFVRDFFWYGLGGYLLYLTVLRFFYGIRWRRRQATA